LQGVTLTHTCIGSTASLVALTPSHFTPSTSTLLTELLTQHILENAIGNKTTPPLSQEDFREVRTCTDV